MLSSVSAAYSICEKTVQVIFAGDFFQLQPIPEKQTFTSKDQFLNKGLAFEAPAWHKANLNTVILKHVFRQVCFTITNCATFQKVMLPWSEIWHFLEASLYDEGSV